MKKLLLLTLLPVIIFYCSAAAQMKYGYAVLYLRCGNDDAQRDKVYYSPIIELDRLNFNKYTEGVDPEFTKYSVRYYNYAIAKWFEYFLKDRYHISINDAEKYERNSISVVLYDGGGCSGDKTGTGCFFTNRQQLIRQRNKAIEEIRLPKNETEVCEVVVL